jgi:hypothetical protein
MNTIPRIPSPVIAVVSSIVSECETHGSLDSLFMYAGAQGDPPPGSKLVKAQEWLRRVNLDESVIPMDVLGSLIEGYMEADCDTSNSWGEFNAARRDKIDRELSRAGLQYVKGGRICGVTATPSHTLQDIIKDRDTSSINEEFERALRNIETSPREAVSAACNILESVCKTYIDDEGLEMPKKQDLQQVWSVVRKDLGFDPSLVEDRDLKEILSGMLSTVHGIAALRTHASSAHGSGRCQYRLEPRHARLAVHSAHTIVSFILESWDKRRGRGTSKDGSNERMWSHAQPHDW